MTQVALIYEPTLLYSPLKYYTALYFLVTGSARRINDINAHFLGNNIYGEAIRDELSKEDNSRTQYVLMEKIRPPVLKNYIVQVHKREILEEDVVCEFGVFGVVIRLDYLRNQSIGRGREIMSLKTC